MLEPDQLPPAPRQTATATAGTRPGRERASLFPDDLILEPLSRRPTVLPEATVRAVRDLSTGAGWALAAPKPVPFGHSTRNSGVRVSIVVVTRDNFIFSKLCLESVLANTDYPHYELIVVDNGSGPELLSYLDQLTARHPFIQCVRNDTNRGFAAANNQGLALARGDVFVLLNNDTIVPTSWLSRFVRHLDNPQLGAVGPVTNRVGNEAQIETSYRTYAEFQRFAREYTQDHSGMWFQIQMLAMFCFAIRRETHERVGPLDERYHIGTFEDEDYAMRLLSSGYRLACAEDVFIHHFGGASLGSLLRPGEYQELLAANRLRFEREWGIKWHPHRHRPSPGYRALIGRINAVAGEVIPAGSTVLVISKGDPDLIKLDGMDARHFPQDATGAYAGHYPAQSDQAISHLECLRRTGANYLLLPAFSLWWLAHYIDFHQYLASSAEQVFHRSDVCAIFRLCRPAQDV